MDSLPPMCPTEMPRPKCWMLSVLWVDLYKVDLKDFNDRNYRKLGGVLKHVLDTIRDVI